MLCWFYQAIVTGPVRAHSERSTQLVKTMAWLVRVGAQPCPSNWNRTSIVDYREELILSLFLARQLANETIQQSQRSAKPNLTVRYVRQISNRRMGFDQVSPRGNWQNRKLSRPRHGPYKIITLTDTDITTMKICFPEDGSIKVHQGWVTKCPFGFPAGCYWYRDKRQGWDVYQDDSRHCVKSRSQKQDQSKYVSNSTRS